LEDAARDGRVPNCPGERIVGILPATRGVKGKGGESDGSLGKMRPGMVAFQKRCVLDN